MAICISTFLGGDSHDDMYHGSTNMHSQAEELNIDIDQSGPSCEHQLKCISECDEFDIDTDKVVNETENDTEFSNKPAANQQKVYNIASCIC